jgi:anaerobic magnesium-protoporphyrin IX monomethyl ester cyclase
MNFLLIRPNDHQSEEKKLALSPTYPPLGLLYIAAALEKNGHKVKIIDYNQESFSKETLANNLNNVDVVGLSVYNANLECAKYISKTIKEIKPEIPIIIGGPYCIFHKMKTLEHIQDSDIVISGEGEEVIINLVKYFQGKKKIVRNTWDFL